MVRQELGPAAMRVAQAVAGVLPGEEFIVGCSGGADSMALALGAQWAARRSGAEFRAVIVDHGLQDGSDQVAGRVHDQLCGRGISAEVRRVQVSDGAGPEAAARDARLGALASEGLPVLLGHTLDDQAETVLLGLARGSGTRSLTGMAPRRGLFVRPLLGLRRDLTRQACREWGLTIWQDPHNESERFTRVRVRQRVLPTLEAELGPGIAEALARTAELCRMDAEVLDALLPEGVANPNARWLAGLEEGIRLRWIKEWLTESGARGLSFDQVCAVAALVTDWRGQKGIDLSGGRVVRSNGQLRFVENR